MKNRDSLGIALLFATAMVSLIIPSIPSPAVLTGRVESIDTRPRQIGECAAYASLNPGPLKYRIEPGFRGEFIHITNNCVVAETTSRRHDFAY